MNTSLPPGVGEVAAGPIRAAAVIGGGTIGLGWAHLFCRAGIRTVVHDPDPTQLCQFEGRLARELDAFVSAGRMTAEAADQALALLHVDADLDEAVGDVDYVQECAPEDLGVKKAVFERLSRAAGPETILASSTSALPMTRIAEEVKAPERCIVAHPTNPPHLLPLVEVVRGERTSERTVSTTWTLLRQLGQTPIMCHKEIFGFVLNRLQFALVREALYLVREGVADVGAIDACVTDGLGLRWAFLGPFGVEATNSANLRENLTKFNQTIRDLVDDVTRPYDGPTEADIESLVEQFEQVHGADAYAALREHRDRLVLELRAVKEGALS